MTFAESAQNVRVDEGHLLRASLRNNEGNQVDAEIDLNQFIGNQSGNFAWGGQGFAGSAQNIAFSLEGASNAPILRAELQDGNGNAVGRDLNLGERITNNNGQFAYN